MPALLMSGVVLYYLTDRPLEARWLAADERQWLESRLDSERQQRESILDLSWLKAMLDYRVITLGLVYIGCNIPQYGLSFFLPQIVKAFGVSNLAAGFIWGAHSDKTGQRTWHAVIAFLFMIAGLVGGALVDDPALKMLLLCVAGSASLRCCRSSGRYRLRFCLVPARRPASPR